MRERNTNKMTFALIVLQKQQIMNESIPFYVTFDTFSTILQQTGKTMDSNKLQHITFIQVVSD